MPSGFRLFARLGLTSSAVTFDIKVNQILTTYFQIFITLIYFRIINFCIPKLALNCAF